ncbi:hypothetical protein [Myxococcus landrumensis]|uniref:Lipoprotein n=1 Tax=Myxococcus landrumensis TaxID=2813577 RepID=A0ABX7NMR9_9BACT|nr:hypothetical protein [Myxococcus landrumus]QSQ17543.1 hypothetical protein JY572_16520 [Myxococcus landrumus]
MNISLRLSSLLVASSIAFGCAGGEPEAGNAPVETATQEATDPNFRIYNMVEAVLPAANYDGVPGNECIALLNPEYRLRKIILVESVAPGATCTLSTYTAGKALSFTWGDSSVYQGTAGIAAIRTALNDSNGAVHRLVGSVTNEATTLAHLQNSWSLTDAQQSAIIGSVAGVRVHSLYDFEGQEEVYAEAAYQDVRVTGPCENPGTPTLNAHTINGFVYGYSATNTGSCHSGWFTVQRVYNRHWHLVYSYSYSE